MIRAGLVGYGLAGRVFHAPQLVEAGCELAAVATSSPDRGAQVRADLPDALVVPDLEALLAVPSLDLVVLASPSGVHAAQVRDVVDAGVACVVDKPLAVDAASAAEAVRHAESAGVPLTVYQNRRYDPEHTTLRAVVAGGLVGEPFRLELRWERWRPVPRDRWRETATAEEGGGLLLDLHSHLVDAATQLLGPVERVAATVSARSTTAEDDAFLLCTHASGATSHLSATSMAGAPGPRVRLLGTGGAYVLADFEGEAHPWSGQRNLDADHCGWLYGSGERVAVPTVPSTQADLYRAVTEALDAPEPQAAMPVDPWDAVQVLAVLDAARVAGAEQRVVEVTTVR